MTPPPFSFGDALRDALPTYPAPESLRAFAREQAVADVRIHAREQRARLMRRMAYAAGIVLAVGFGWVGHDVVRRTDASAEASSALVTALVDVHVRSLMAGHLMDVQSTDQHTVKPWFAGKVDFAPHVADLAADGFPLLGGRVEYISAHSAVALIYGRRAHVVNLLIWPATASDGPAETVTRSGYSLVHWIDHGMSFWAVSDAAMSEVQAFERSYLGSM